MQEVYNKTMAMLFRGTKNLANNNAGIEMEEAEEEAQSKDKVTKFESNIFFLIYSIFLFQVAYKQLSLKEFGLRTS